jgi:hypothetical protein
VEPEGVWSRFRGKMETPFCVLRSFLSGLRCLGPNLPPASSFTSATLVFQLSGSYFSSDYKESRKKALYLNPTGSSHALPSCDTKLLSRFLRMHRAMVQQSSTNKNFIESLVMRGLDVEEAKTRNIRAKSRTLKEQVFQAFQTKETETRIAETELMVQLENMRVRIESWRSEKARVMEAITRKKLDCAELSRGNEKRLEAFAQHSQVLESEETQFKVWLSKHKENKVYIRSLCDTVRATQLELISKFGEIFTIQVPLDATPATMRWISLPSASEAKANWRQEQAFSAVLGWTAQLVSTIACIAGKKQFLVNFKLPLKKFL